MSVATLLGIEDPVKGHLAEAANRWSTWAEEAPELSVVDGPEELKAWLWSMTGRGATPSMRDEADLVLGALARQASPHGGDDVAAAMALAYVLLPGAKAIAASLSRITHDSDQVVASQLWLEVRAYRWERLTRVATNILGNTRREVLRQVIFDDCTLVDPCADAWQLLETQSRPDVEDDWDTVERTWRLRLLLQRAVTEKVITDWDRTVLMTLAQAAHEHGAATERGGGGLYSAAVLTTVAQDLGWSATTVRRRAQASIRAISRRYAALPVAS